MPTTPPFGLHYDVPRYASAWLEDAVRATVNYRLEPTYQSASAMLVAIQKAQEQGLLERNRLTGPEKQAWDCLLPLRELDIAELYEAAGNASLTFLGEKRLDALAAARNERLVAQLPAHYPKLSLSDENIDLGELPTALHYYLHHRWSANEDLARKYLGENGKIARELQAVPPSGTRAENRYHRAYTIALHAMQRDWAREKFEMEMGEFLAQEEARAFRQRNKRGSKDSLLR